MNTPALGLLLAAFLGVRGGFSFDKKNPGPRLPRGPKAVNGVLDLSEWDFERNGPATLAGEWHCLPGALISDTTMTNYDAWPIREVPDNWQHNDPSFPEGKGAATYELTVILPQYAPSLSIRNYTGLPSFELEISGRIIKHAGTPSLSPQNAVSGYAPGVCPIGATDDIIHIIIRTSNYEYRSGGIWRAFELGDSEALEHSRALSFYTALVIASMILALALNYFIIFLFRKRETSFLFFSIEGLGLFLRPLFTGEYPIISFFPNLPFHAVVKGEYLSALVAVAAGCAFFVYFFKPVKKNLPYRLLSWASAVFFLAFLALPLYYLTQIIFIFYVYAISGFSYVIIAILIPALKEHRHGAVGLLAGLIVLLAGSANYLLSSAALIHTPDVFPYAIIILVGCQSIVLARHLTSAFKEAERFSTELGKKNEALEQEIVQENIARKELQKALNEEQMLLKEVHHRVKNSLQIVSSIVGLKTMDTTDPAVKELAQTIRNRIRVVSLVHERLYNVGTGDKIDLGSYLTEIAGLNIEYAELGAQITSNITIVNSYADGGFCIDAGLILTELLANALRHAVIGAEGGKITVSARTLDNDLILEIDDNGPGFPQGFNPQKDGGLGFKIINSLLSRRKGIIQIIEGSGGRIRCTMPIE